DLKPSNVLIRAEDDAAVILDFGIAHAEGEVELTAEQMPGTLAYEAPEQIESGRRKADEAIDIWALGVLLYRLLTGTHPFRGDDAAALAREILYVDPPRPRDPRPGIPPALESLALECLAKDPAKRPPRARDVAARLERWLDSARAGTETTATAEPP